MTTTYDEQRAEKRKRRTKHRKQKRCDRPVPLSKSGRPMHELSKRALKSYECGWCSQRLDRMKDSPRNCAALDPQGGPCHWYDTLNPDEAVKRQWRDS